MENTTHLDRFDYNQLSLSFLVPEVFFLFYILFKQVRIEPLRCELVVQFCLRGNKLEKLSQGRDVSTLVNNFEPIVCL